MALESSKKLNVLYCIILKAFIDTGYYPKLVLQHFYEVYFHFYRVCIVATKSLCYFYAKEMLSGFSAGHDWLADSL
jgi:hypothetical protein